MAENIHNRIYRLRTELGMSQADLAKHCGLNSWQSVQQWESGRTKPKLSRFPMLAKALGVSEQELLFGTDALTPTQALSESLLEKEKPAESATEIADTLRMVVRAIAARWNIVPEDLLDPSPEAKARVERAITNAHRHTMG